RELFRELVETDTTHSNGSCTLAAERMAARLRAAGLPDGDLHRFDVPGYPKDGGLVAVYPGRDPKAPAVLLLAHLDVVEARREDWTRDPFKLVEEHGEFYGRGVSDDKSMAAIFVDLLARFADEHYRPRRTVKLALTCGEESGARIDTAQWLVEHERRLIDAGIAINEFARGELDAQGRRVALEIQAGEKTAQTYRLEVTNPGGHSSRPRRDNAIYALAGALKRIEAYEFPAEFNDTTRAYFAGLARIEAAAGEAELARAMTALARDPGDAASIARVAAADPSWNAMLRTTCVATTVEAGHALNALPQRAVAHVNCRIFPGTTAESVRGRLEQVVSDPAVTVSALAAGKPASSPPPLTASVLGPVERLAAEFWPGVPVLPVLQAGATDGVYLTAAGIPTYGIEPIFVGPDLGNIHGLNEHVGVDSLLEGREFLYRLVRIYAEAR
ncbi:MAG: M20/M25/M40 family metallo-hydrolase, partial [Proteobacteria bacterium]|nr:M20/M25/M40 family metallo-hydrolase [Pseudomonadota bacterium]